MAFPEEQSPLLTQFPEPDLWAVWRRRRWQYERAWFIRELTLSYGHRLLFAQNQQAASVVLRGNVPTSVPVHYARAPDGALFMSSGLIPMIKWDGVRLASEDVGVPAPTQAVTLAFSGTGDITGSYTAYTRWLDRDGNPSNLSPVSAVAAADDSGTVTYTNVEAPTHPKVLRRQILRNTAGQALTYYVDVDTDDLSETSFTSTNDDDDLQASTAVPLFDDQGNSLANRYGIPRSDKPFIAAYLDRMFAAGEVAYAEGHCEVTAGSTTVRGVGTSWTTAMAGRFLYVVGAGLPYEIDSADEDAQTLTLVSVWTGATDKLAVYTIRSAPAERNLIVFSEAGLYEAWPATNGLSVEENGDDVTGLMVADSFLYVLQRRHIYRLTYHFGPLVDGGLFLSARRGCVNQRSWVYADGHTYLLDEQGAYRFAGGDESEGLSAPIQDLFYLDRPGGGLRVNWKSQRWFHALHSQDERTVRWFVALSGNRLPRHALCFNYDSNLWWVEEYPFPVGHSAVTDGVQQRPIVCGPARRVFAHAVGTLDGPDPAAGTTRALATSVGVEHLAAPGGTVFPASGVVGFPVAVVDGRGKGQTNLVASVSGTTLRLARPWAVRPDSTSTFQLGGVPWLWRSGLYRWLNVEGDQQRGVELVFPPCARDAQCDLRIYREFAAEAEKYGYDWPTTSAERDGFRVEKDSADAVIDLSYLYGFVKVRRSGRRERNVGKADVFGLELEGFSGEAPISVYEVNVDGATGG